MTRRRQYKRSRQKKGKFHKTREHLRKNVQSGLLNSRNEDEETNGESRLYQRSPESVLCESQHMDPLDDDKLSPGIIPKRSKRRRSNSGIDDETAAQMIEQSSPISSKDREPSLPRYDFKDDTAVKYVNDFVDLEDSGEHERNAVKSIVDVPCDLLTESYSFSTSSLSNEPNNNGTRNERSSLNTISAAACRNISRLTTSRPNLGPPQSCDAGVCTFANSDAKRSPGVAGSGSERNDHYILETMNDCYLLDKTLSINDNLMRESNGYLDGQPSTGNKLGGNRTPKLSHFTILRETGEQSELAELSARRSVARSVDGSRDKLNKKKRKTRRSNSKGFEKIGALERIGDRLTENWREFRKIFAHLRRASRRIRGADAIEREEVLLHRYRRLPYTISVSTLSLPTSAPNTPSFFPKRLDHDETRESGGTSKREAEKVGISSESTTPHAGLVKRCCRTTLMFGNENEGEAARHRQPATRADIADSHLEKKKEECSFPPEPSSLNDEAHQKSRVPESTIASDIELSERDGRCSLFPQKVYNPHKEDTF